MRLTRSTLDGRGIVRKRRGKGFAYYGPDGELLDDPEAERHGLATLLCEHVTVRSRAAVFDIKDLRTWHGTVLAAAAFAAAKEPTSPTRVKKEASAVMKEVAAELGNTPAVARKFYVDPRVVDGYAHGMTISSAVKRAAKSPPDEGQAILEKATRTLIRRVAKG